MIWNTCVLSNSEKTQSCFISIVMHFIWKRYIIGHMINLYISSSPHLWRLERKKHQFLFNTNWQIQYMDVKLLRTIKTSVDFSFVSHVILETFLEFKQWKKDGNEEMVSKTQIYLLKQSNRLNPIDATWIALSISFRNITFLKIFWSLNLALQLRNYAIWPVDAIWTQLKLCAICILLRNVEIPKLLVLYIAIDFTLYST